MRTLCIIACVFCISGTWAQPYVNDSLTGFNTTQVVSDAHLQNYFGDELKVYLQNKQREFINNKYQLNKTAPHPSYYSKYSSGFINNLPCLDEGFENQPLGVMSFSTPGWNATQGSFVASGTCGSATTAYNPNSTAVVVHTTPVTDANFPSGVPNSPLGGAKVVSLNKIGGTRAKLTTTFPVTSTNWAYQYAFMAYLVGGGHLCCDEGFVMFRFYDCNNNLISATSRTYVTNSSCPFSPTTGWTAGAGTLYTPTWISVVENLSPYIGTCVSLEITASACNGGSHSCYCYFDSQCSDNAILANGTFFANNSYTSCSSTANLSAAGGFNSYSWDGPPGSGITANTSSVITAATTGVYTLSAVTGTSALTQTFNLVVNPSPATISIAGSSTLCSGSSVTLQAIGNNFSGYTWNGTAGGATLAISPMVTSTYSLSAISSSGCVSSAVKTVTVFTSPALSIIGGNSGICAGAPLSLFASAGAVTTYSWNNGLTTPSITVSPSTTTSYTVWVTDGAGCMNSATKMVTILPQPQVTLQASSPSVCAGQPLTLVAMGSGNTAYNWSTGATAASISFSPANSAMYSVTVTSSSGCTAQASTSVIVHPTPQIQILSSNPDLCKGESISLMIIGSNIGSILWSTAQTTQSISISPLFSSVYTATVTSGQGCSAADVKSVTVHDLPQISISSIKTDICKGEFLQLMANATEPLSYSWTTGATGSMVVVQPTVTTSYTVTGVNSNGCKNAAYATIGIQNCSGIVDNRESQQELVAYPNPSSDMFTIRSNKRLNGILINTIGEVIAEVRLNETNHYSQTFSGLAKGIYFVSSMNGTLKVIVK